MPTDTTWKYHQQSDLSGGENRNLREVAPNQLLIGWNMIKRTDGALQTRLGKTQVGNITAPNAQCMIRFKRINGTESLAIQGSDGVTVLSYNGVDPPTFKSKFVKTITNRCHMLYWHNRLLLTNSIIGLYKMVMDTEEAPPVNSTTGSLTAEIWTMTFNVQDGVNTNSKLIAQPISGLSLVVFQGYYYQIDNVSHKIVTWKVGNNESTASWIMVNYPNTEIAREIFVISDCVLVNFDTYSWYSNIPGSSTGTLGFVFEGYNTEFTNAILGIEASGNNTLMVYLAAETWEISLTNGVFNTIQVVTSTPPPVDIMVPILDAASNPIMGTCLAIYGERLYVGEGDLLKCSEVADPETFDVLNVIQISGGDGDNITALIPVTGGLVICKRNTTWVLYGDSYLDWQLTRSPIALCGAVNPWSEVHDGFRFMFVGRDNLYTGTLTGVQPITQTHAPLVQQITEAQRYDSFMISLPQDNGRIVVFLGSGDVLNIETILGGIFSWSPLLSAAAGSGCGNSMSDDDGKLLFVDTSGVIYKLIGDTDSGQKIETKIIHGYTNMGTDRKKQFRRIMPKFGAEYPDNTVTMMVSTDIDYRLSNDLGDINMSFKDLEFKTFEHNEISSDHYSNVHGALELHQSRGHVMAVMMSSSDRIVYTGCTVKYREVAAW